jgi:nucleoid-associated protein YgaU
VKTDTFTLTVDRPTAPPTSVPAPAPAPVAAANPNRAEGRIQHKVVRGDTLWDIAEHYLGDAGRFPELAKLSGIRDPNLIYPGDIVTIDKVAPGAAGRAPRTRR